MTLTEFLLARIAEDEAIAVDAEKEIAEWYDKRRTHHGSALAVAIDDPHPVGVLESASRVFAECQAKRLIVTHALLERELGPHRQSDTDAAPHFADKFLRALALPYADHPDYREGWRP